ncbi:MULTISPECIES: RNA-directed DNA polymerase [unclassified Pseudomonas]|uniref:RNA-directed DNA polymerase n=1 Tax=unclassified Pseudomonas TaxID=196821 RepID=UPI0002726280|nr:MULTISPECIES: RNA-directed DNA polymerase [unclassified Pseudomonas]EJM08498.1 hypothetical protein PMI19_00057 [Pseudomonas sp. GM16]EJM33361.1 hypothetical protein PMI23_03981 [Pseudomonas sp. GM24]
MSYKAEFNGWSEITLADLLVAYRKAKADCYFENTFPASIKFADYEQDLLVNLSELLERLRVKQGFSKDPDLIGEFRILPKKLSLKQKSNAPENGHVHFSNSNRAMEDLLYKKDVTPEFRVVGDFPVDAHVLSALWINTVGHKFDAMLGSSCYGARLKRVNSDELFADSQDKPLHISAIGSFVSYFQPYQKWRNDGLTAIRSELEQNREIIAASLDLKAFYHFVDPLILASSDFHAELGLELNGAERDFTVEFAKFLKVWAEGAEKFSKKIISNRINVPGGLAIGLTASRVISNVLLFRWDNLIKEKIAPVHYGRYVDDMFLVLRDTGTIRSSEDFMNFLQNRLGTEVISRAGNAKKQIWQIYQGEDFQGNSKIKLQADKQKLFVLQGRAGLDLLDTIEKEISELSSEHRLMPSPNQLEDSTAARVLSAAGSVGESADTLRRADGLTIRRLSWSLQLRHVETLARDLPAQEWHEQRQEFYQFAHDHILRPDNLFAHFTYLPRLLGFAISMNEWQEAEKIALQAYRCLQQLSVAVPKGMPISINGVDAKSGANLWLLVKGTLTWLFVDAATRYYDPDRLLLGTRSKKEQRLADLFLKGIFDSLLEVESLLGFRFGSEDFEKKAPLVALADLAHEPYKRILRSRAAGGLIECRKGNKGAAALKLLEASMLLDTSVLKSFLKSSRRSRLPNLEQDERKKESYLPYLFPTRPLSPLEISELAPECVGLCKINGNRSSEKPSTIWAQYTQALGGVWIQPTLLATEQDCGIGGQSQTSNKYIRIGTERKKKLTIALTNLKTDEADWAAMACGKPNLSRERYQRIAELINQSIKLTPKPDYVLFPELSIPLKWVDSLASRLIDEGISLIAGTEYRHCSDDEVFSEACLVLTDNRLGYPSAVKIWQPKLLPAVGEDKELISRYGKKWADSKILRMRTKPVYIHNGINFGVMVCSELQNSKERVRFQGEIDALMVLSWNQDLETFSSLVEAAALDVHAYTVLVNNRKYGDSRVRAPAKESFMRDIARVRGGDNDFVIAATLDVDALRAFQSRAKRWAESDDKFKPVPEGFKMSSQRRKTPPK